MPVKFYKSLIITNGQYPAKRLEEKEKATLEFFDSETHLVYVLCLFVFFNQESRVLQIQMVFLLWPTPKKHKNIPCIFLTLFITIFLSGTSFPCLHGKLLFVLQSPVLSIVSSNHSFIKNRIYSVSEIFPGNGDTTPYKT